MADTKHCAGCQSVIERNPKYSAAQWESQKYCSGSCAHTNRDRGPRAICTVEGCDGVVHGWGYCRKHYQRHRSTGDPLGIRPRPTGLTYRLPDEDEAAYEERRSMRFCPQPPCACGCGTGARWLKAQARWARCAEGHTKPTLKSCNRCGREERGRTGLCRACRNEYMRERRQDSYIREREVERTRAWRQSPEGQKALKAYRSRRYGLSVAERDEMFSRGCEICGSHDRMCIDHCHDTGKVRGPLCGRCNSGIGFLRDDPALARAAAAYLEKHK